MSFRKFVKRFKLTGNKDDTVCKQTKCFSHESKSAVECKGRSNYTHIYWQVQYLWSDNWLVQEHPQMASYKNTLWRIT